VPLKGVLFCNYTLLFEIALFIHLSTLSTANDADHRARYANQFTRELARHSIAEELIVYPAMENWIGLKGEQLADNERPQHNRLFSRATP